MKKTHFVILIGLLAISRFAWAGANEDAIVALEQQWIQAELANNADLSTPLFADTASIVGIDGKVRTKAEFVASERATKYERAALDDMKVTVYGDAAIAVYIFKAKGVDSDGKPFELQERATDTWVKLPTGTWQLVASHGSLIKP